MGGPAQEPGSAERHIPDGSSEPGQHGVVPSPGDLVRAWLRYNSEWRYEPDEDDPDWWAIEALTVLTHDEPDEAWNLLLDIVRASDTDWQLAMVGSGVLEDLLHRNPDRYVPALEEAAESNRKLVTAAASVWLDDEPAGPRIAALLQRYDQPRM